MRSPNAAHHLEPAFIDRSRGHADVQEGPDHCGRQSPNRDPRLQLSNADLPELVMQSTLASLPREADSGWIDAGSGLQRRRAIDGEECPFGPCLARVAPG